MKSHLPVLIPIILFCAALLGTFTSLISRFLTRGIAYLGMIFGFLACFSCFQPVLQGGSWRYALGGWAPPWGIELVITPFSCFFLCSILVLSGMTLFYTRDFLPGDKIRVFRNNLFDVLLLFLTAILSTMILCRDLFTLYFLMELSILAGGGLILVTGEKFFLDGFRFVFWGSVGSSFFLLGVGYLYSATGTLHLGDLLAQLFIYKNYTLIVISGAFLTVGWALHLCLPAPFFFSGLLRRAPASLLAFLASVFVRVGTYWLFLLLFFGLGVPGLTQPGWLMGLERMIAALFLVGFVFATQQKSIRALLAYLSLGQLAYPFMGLCLGNKTALTGVLFELLNQLLVVAGLFFIAENLEKIKGIHEVEGLHGLVHKMPVTSLLLMVIASSIVGIPPTAGSFGKWYLLQGAIEKKDWFFVAGLAVTSFFNLAFWLILFWKINSKEKHLSVERPLRKLTLVSKAPIGLLTAGILALGLFHQNVIHDFIEPSLPKAFLNMTIPNVPFLGKEVE